MRYILLMIISLLAIAGDGFAAPACRIQRFDEGDGLSQWHVTQMTQDGLGMMWFSTWNGLCRFDGYVFKSFKGHVGDGSAIATDRMRSVWLAPDGSLTCKVDEGLYRFSLKSYRFESASLKPKGINATAVKADRPYRYRDGAGVVWTVYYDGRLTYALKGKPEMAYTGHGAMESARFCMPDRQGNLWVVAADCIYRLSFPQQRGTITATPDGAEVKAFLTDSRRRYWIATKEDKEVRIFDSANKLVGYLAPDGQVAVGERAFACPVYCMTQTSDGTIWLGSKPGGLMRLADMGGGMRYRVERVAGLSSDNVYDIKEDRWGRLWVATLGGGICCIPNPKAQRPEVLTPMRGLGGFPLKQAPKVRMMHITRGDILLAATTGGLLVGKLQGGNRVGGMRFRLHRREADRTDALSCSATMNIAEDSRGRIFISTESGGVNMIVSADLLGRCLSFRHFGEAEGLPTDVALCVMPFGGRMLVVSSSSIVLFSPDGGSAQQFGRGYFLTPCRFSEALPMRLPDGRWMFGMKNGLFAAAPAQLRKSAYRPSIALTALSVQGKEKDFAINAADTLRLGSRERSLTLQFAALDYSAPENVSYAFALAEEGSGEKTKWNFIGHDHSATLLDLEPGTYQLLIRSTNADGTWVENTRRLTIIVTPTFWETTAARVIIVLLLMAAVGAIVYTLLYIRRINRQRREVLEAYLGLLSAGEKEQQERKPLAPKLSDEDDRLMRRMSAYVEEHLSDADISVGDMADAVAMSRSALQRRLKQVAGVTPLDFLREARQKRAEQLLRETAMTVSEVAFACGYSDPKYFSRTFKASTGKSPTEWRIKN